MMLVIGGIELIALFLAKANSCSKIFKVGVIGTLIIDSSFMPEVLLCQIHDASVPEKCPQRVPLIAFRKAVVCSYRQLEGHVTTGI